MYRWQKEKHDAICRAFGYDGDGDRASARRLDGILRGRSGAAGPGPGHGGGADPYAAMQDMIGGSVALVVGAGPSLGRSIAALSGICGARKKPAVMIAADTAVRPLMQAGITPDVITTDLDGDIDAQAEASRRGAIVIVHAHGDNSGLLHHAERFESCMGTTQAEPFGLVRNLGGFTDGDRAIFVADHFAARRIILFGMDFGRRIGRHSGTAGPDRDVKIRKMGIGRGMVEEWFAGGRGRGHAGAGRLFTTSGRIRGFARVPLDRVRELLP